MVVHRLSLQHFRNFQIVGGIEFPPKAFLVAAAPNATGKTNFLEALVVLLRGKSFRAQVRECVQWGADSFLLHGEVEGKEGKAQLAVRYHAPTKKMRIEENGEPISPVLFYTRYPLIVFLPEDTFLFQRGPAYRRTFLNHVLSSVPGYLAALVQYHRVLKNRNTALKGAQTYSDVQAWTELLIERGVVVWGHREGFVQFVTERLSQVYQAITTEERSFVVRLTVRERTREVLAQELENAFSDECRYGHTLSGPHRDDLEILTEGRPIQAVLSRGQLRSVVIALKLIAHTYITQVTGEAPLLLLDDILSELDDKRQSALLMNLPDTQTLLTCTAVPEVLHDRPGVSLLDLRSIIHSEAGVVSEAEEVASAATEESVAVPTT